MHPIIHRAGPLDSEFQSGVSEFGGLVQNFSTKGDGDWTVIFLLKVLDPPWPRSRRYIKMAHLSCGG